ncbi:hypothetical protein C4K03_1798 [Pseudomonas synxantha]|uniref:Uncharacterized protein n=1 Tax=Pseudomonas synxantha TaxID=47883 RepID=A0A3G7U3R2_9PSED|nr:hypothetical protein C4K03_1798 [Pseudomonas synxantha]
MPGEGRRDDTRVPALVHQAATLDNHDAKVNRTDLALVKQFAALLLKFSWISKKNR